jgi:hypothetical protein
MKIGIITYCKVLNFGANLQAVSTYLFLKNHGDDPIFINYISNENLVAIEKGKTDSQWNAHMNFVNSVIKEQTPICQSAGEILKIVEDEKIEGIIVGSDALLQHHPFITRIKKARRKIIFIMPVTSDRLFPNLFWGCGIADKIPMALMSVSSQNSEYNFFLPSTKKAMKRTLENIRYISVRDVWTQNMVYLLTNKKVPITPDPVFAFNQNATFLIPSKDEICQRFNLPNKYVLMSLFSQSLSETVIADLRRMLNEIGVILVILPLPSGVHFHHRADIEITRPLSPIDWYAILKYSYAYVGCNMHPIVICLHNAVPCFSIDNWGCTDFWGKNKNDGSSKVQHIMNVFGVDNNHRFINKGKCNVTAKEILYGIETFPRDKVKNKALLLLSQYNQMMDNMLSALKVN